MRIWINRATNRVGHGGTTLLGSSSIPAGSPIACTGEDAIPDNVIAGNTNLETGLVTSGTDLACFEPGLYLIGFCGTVDGLTSLPPNGSALIVGLAVRPDSAIGDVLGTPAGYFGMRRHYVDSDQYGGSLVAKGAENISFQGRLNLAAGDRVQAYNAGAYDFNITYGYLWGMRIGNYISE